jgi:outer membrane protein assembly factor BamB
VVLAGDYNVMPTDLDVYKPERWLDDALFRPEVRREFHALTGQGWTDAVRALHPNEKIYTFWDYFRNAYARDAGLRIDHLLLSPSMAGRLVWKKHLGSEYGPFQINWGHGSSPLVHAGTLILLCYHERASYLLALDARTGAVRWKVDAPAGVTSYSTPLAVDAAGRTEVIVNSSIGVSGHDLATGERLWHVTEDNRFPIPMPLYQDGVIYTSRGYRSSPFMAIRPGGKGDVSSSHVIWRSPSGAPYISSLVYYDGLIYMIGDVGVLTVTDAKTGERVFQERIGGVYTASPVAADGKVYLLSEDGETVVVAAGRTPRVLARNKLNARQLASPAISGGRLFIRSDDAIYAIGK